MPDEDARITDFIPDDGKEEGNAPDGDANDSTDPAPDGADEPPGDADAPEADAVAPAEPTSTWRADGACEACGAAVERRWREGGALVCSDCRDW